MLPIEFQLLAVERIEKLVSTVNRVTIALAFVALALLVWMQAPGLEFKLPLGGFWFLNNFLLVHVAAHIKKKIGSIGEHSILRGKPH